MAISIIGTPQTGTAINGGDVTLTFSTTPSKDDIAVVFAGSSNWDDNPVGISTTGYIEIASFTASSSGRASIGAFYKRMGASPDSTVTCTGDGHSFTATAGIAYILRGVDVTTALDVAATTAGETLGVPTAPAITTVTNGAWVVIGAGNGGLDTSPGTVSGYSNHYNAAANDTVDASFATATKEIASFGTETPGAWGSWSTGYYYAITIAFRPSVGAPTAIASLRTLRGVGR